MLKKKISPLLLPLFVTVAISCESVDPMSSPSQQVTSEMFVGLWEQVEGCSCNNGFDLCFYPDGNLFLSHSCDSSSFYSIERDTLWLDGTRPAVASFDTLSDESVVMMLHVKFPLCLQPEKNDNGWYDFTYIKRNGFVSFVDSISPEDILGIWEQESECSCIKKDTLMFEPTGLFSRSSYTSSNEYYISGNILYETIPSPSGSTVMEHPMKITVWPDGKKMLRIMMPSNPCNINCVVETINYFLVQ